MIQGGVLRQRSGDIPAMIDAEQMPSIQRRASALLAQANLGVE